MTTAAERAWADLGAAQFVSLGTFRRSGQLVTAPIWLAPDGADLVATSEVATGKIKRLRRDDRVVMQVCSRFGDIEDGAPAVPGRCVVAGPNAEHPAAMAALRRKYGRQFTGFLFVERWIRRFQRKNGARVILRISPESAGVS